MKVFNNHDWLYSPNTVSNTHCVIDFITDIPMPVHTAPPYNNKPQGKIVCRFGVTCQNVYCPFQHPTVSSENMCFAS